MAIDNSSESSDDGYSASLLSDSITVNATDSFGNAASTNTDAVSGSPALVPVLAAPSTLTLGVGESGGISGVSLSEFGTAGGATFTVTLSDTNGKLAATGTGVTGAGSTSLTITGTLAQVNADLATLTDFDAATPSDTITLNATDNLGNHAAAKTVAVTVNGLPVLAAPTSAALTQGNAGAIAGLALSESGNTTGETFTVTLSDDNGELSATGTGISGSGTTNLTIFGSLAAVNADLATLTDTDAVVPDDDIAVVATDGLGNAASRNISVGINPLMPQIAAPVTADLTQGNADAIAPVVLSEPDSVSGETFTVTLADGQGLLSATGTGVTGSGTNNLTIAGSLATVNADLATLTDTDATTSSDTITVTASDSFGNSIGQSIAVTVAPLVPTLTAPSLVEVTQGQAGAVTGFALSEPSAVAGETFTVRLYASDGNLAANGTGVSGSGTDNLTIAGSLNEVNTELATVTDTTTSAYDTITGQASDGFSNDSTTTLTNVQVRPLVPVLTAPTTATVTQSISAAISGVSLAETGNATGETFSVTLSDTHGDLSATGTGVAGSGTTSLTIGGSLATVNADLATLTDTEAAAPSDTITVTAYDSFGNSAIGQSIAVTILPLVPTLTAPSLVEVTQGQAGAVTGFALSEPNAVAGETFTVTLYASDGHLSATGTGVSGAGTDNLTIAGSLTEVNTELATVTDTTTFQDDSITGQASDGFSNDSATTLTNVQVRPLVPVLTAPATATVTQSGAIAIAGVSLAETGNVTGETFSVTLSDTHGDLSATGTGITGSDTTSLTIGGSLATVNADLATLTDTDAIRPSDTITVTAYDSFGNSAIGQSIAVTVAAPVPAIAAPSALTLGFGKAGAVSGVSLSEPGAASGATFSVTLTDAHGLLSATGTGVSGAGTVSLTVTGTLAAVNADLATLTDTDSLGDSDTIAIKAVDNLGDHANPQYIAVTVNRLPVISAPGSTVTLTQADAGAVSGISLAETGNTTGEYFTVTLSDTHGLLSATGTGVSGSGTTTLTIAGTLAAVNADLATLSDTDSVVGSDTIGVTATDSFGNASASAALVPVSVEAVLCFLAGTLIATPHGERPVEDLVAGEIVLTASGRARPITWIGHGRILAAGGRRTAATPVIVHKGAFADNVPHHDLRVTKGHSFYLDGVLIPVEFLVNHRSVRWDDHARDVSLYHIELESHDVLLANGAPAESYRDDGNRWLFDNANSGWNLPQQQPCAPVLTGGSIVDAVWRRLMDRAGPRIPVPVTDHPDLHLLVDGRAVGGRRRPGGVNLFYLPRVPGEVRAVSRAGVPAELGLARDPRLLGVAVRQIRLWRGARLRLIEASDPSLNEGFHLFEADNGFRWTNGNARLPARLFDSVDGACELELCIGGTTLYPLLGNPADAKAA